MSRARLVGSAFTGLETAVLAKSIPEGLRLRSARLGGHYAPARGGVPLRRVGEVVGAVAVSGATGDENEISAQAAADWLARLD